MWKKTLSALAVMTIGAGLALGQDASNAGYPAAQALTAGQAQAANPYTPYQIYTSAHGDGGAAGPIAPNGNANGCNTCGCAAERCCIHGWFGVDYLLMFPSRQNHMPVLLTSVAGIAAPNGGVALVGPGLDPGINNGIRVDTGVWLCQDRMAMQGIFWTNFRRYVSNNQAVGIIPLSAPVGPVAVTNFQFQSWHQVSGGEGNTLLRLGSGDGPTKLYGLFGTKYLNIEEDVTIRYTAAAGNFLDEFHSRNQFLGGQFGLKVQHSMGKLLLDLTGKLGLGANFDQMFVLGSNTGGVPFQAFTGQSNIGFYESSYFGLIPELNANASYRITDRLVATVGYNFLCSINNWRPADQITLNNNGGVTQPAISPPVRSTYFLHGLNAGVSFHY